MLQRHFPNFQCVFHAIIIIIEMSVIALVSRDHAWERLLSHVYFVDSALSFLLRDGEFWYRMCIMRYCQCEWDVCSLLFLYWVYCLLTLVRLCEVAKRKDKRIWLPVERKRKYCQFPGFHWFCEPNFYLLNKSAWLILCPLSHKLILNVNCAGSSEYSTTMFALNIATEPTNSI